MFSFLSFPLDAPVQQTLTALFLGSLVLILLRRRSKQSPEWARNRTALKAINHPCVSITPRSILKHGELSAFYAAKDVLKDPAFDSFYLFAQTSLGELFETHSPNTFLRKQAYFAFNARRCDLAITDNHGRPVLMIEYQGEGHYQNDYKTRDEIKRRVCEKANVCFLEIPSHTPRQIIRERIKEHLSHIQSRTQTDLNH